MAKWSYCPDREAYFATFPIQGETVSIFVSDGYFTSDKECDYLPLREGEYYHYQLEGASHLRLSEKSSFVAKASRSGQLKTQTYVGYGRLWIEGHETQVECLQIKVASTVLDYESDYQQLLAEVTEEVTDLQMQVLSEVTALYTFDEAASAKTNIQQFFFLLGIVLDENFNCAMHTIISHPHVKLMSALNQHDIRHTTRFTSGMLRQVASASRRIEVSEALKKQLGIASLPMYLNNTHRVETVDTPENRFIKYVLSFFRKKLMTYKETIDAANVDLSRYAIDVDLTTAIERLNGWLSHQWFREIGTLTSMPSGSMVLQRREGYREIFRKFLQANVAARITWEAGEGLYAANQKDVATLYEYWCYFKLLRIVRNLFELDVTEIREKLWDVGKDSLSLKLNEGQAVTLTGRYLRDDGSGRYRDLAVDFKYNHRFVKEKESWTSTMIPDYTLAFRPACYDESVAKENHLITYIHFDAKYKIKDLIESFAPTEDDLSGKEKDVKIGDLYKMHTYRDAIGRTGGAYVLYPGTEMKDFRQVNGEIVPGLGAFPLTPQKKSHEDALQHFLKQAAEYFCDRISKWEKYTYERAFVYNMNQSVYNTMKDSATDVMLRERDLSECFASRFWDVTQTVSVNIRYAILEMVWIYNHKLFITPEAQEGARVDQNLTLKNLKSEEAASQIRTITLTWRPPILLLVNRYHGLLSGSEILSQLPAFEQFPLRLNPEKRYHIWDVVLLDENPFLFYLNGKNFTDQYKEQYEKHKNKFF